jgi:hypothetical protein
VDLLHWVLFGVLPALAAVLLFVGVGGARFVGIALAVAVCVPFAMASGWPPWPWQISVDRGDGRQWSWWCVAAAGVVGTVYDLRLLPRWVLLPCEAAVIGLLPWLLSGNLRAGWTFEDCVLMLGGAWTVLGLLWWVLREAAKVRPGMAVPLAGAIALTADALVLRAHGLVLGWHLAGVAAVALGTAVATTIWRRPFVCGAGGTLCITVVHAGVLWCERSERQLLQAPFLLAMVAPLGLGIALTWLFAEERGTGVLVGIAAVAVLAGAAVLA